MPTRMQADCQLGVSQMTVDPEAPTGAGKSNGKTPMAAYQERAAELAATRMS